jgi:hypothetical protein
LLPAPATVAAGAGGGATLGSVKAAQEHYSSEQLMAKTNKELVDLLKGYHCRCCGVFLGGGGGSGVWCTPSEATQQPAFIPCSPCTTQQSDGQERGAGAAAAGVPAAREEGTCQRRCTTWWCWRYGRRAPVRTRGAGKKQPRCW